MEQTKWILDNMHSELGFKIKHMMISNVSGTFKNFNIEVETGETGFIPVKIILTAETASISTNNEHRDAHLLASDFLHADQYPELKFSSTNIVKNGDDEFELYGDLTLKGVTKPVQLHVAYSWVAKDPWGGERTGFVVTGKINRSDWGLNFNSVLETGALVLSEEIRINAEIQLVKKAESIAA